MIYPLALALISALVAALERLWPWRPAQRQLREYLWSDLLHLLFNGHFLGVILYGVAGTHLLPLLDPLLARAGLIDALYRGAAAEWPLWAQVVVSMLAIDFMQWCVHNLLHRVPWMWETHKGHHSVRDGEMDWVVSFRFQWTEVAIYRAALYLPLAFFSFSEEAALTHAIFGTLIGHLNHSNLNITWGPLRYIFNSPRMHIWHHDYHREGNNTVNFGIIFSCWDWLFGTAYLPDSSPARIGFGGEEELPRDFLGQQAWPLQRLLPAKGESRVALGATLGVAVLAGGWHLKDPHGPKPLPSAMLGEPLAQSQPGAGAAAPYLAAPASAEEAAAGLGRLGGEAAAAGFRRPEWLASAREVAGALGAPRLTLIDVRPADRFALGHIPTARRADRGDYSHAPGGVSGLSRPAGELVALLERLGARAGDEVVLYGDGGPEPYRMWWTLRAVAGVKARVLDGGLAAWKEAGLPLAGGEGRPAARGDLGGGVDESLKGWALLSLLPAEFTSPRAVGAGALAGAQWLDTRSAVEFSGAERHPKAARAGRVPGARHLEWTRVLGERGELLKPVALRAALAEAGVDLNGAAPLVTYCQSGTRSAAVTFALAQLGVDEARLLNYDGSWAEYSARAALPVEVGDAAP